MKKRIFIRFLAGTFFLLTVFSAGAAGKNEARETD
jgi:hypothetical protein